MPSPPNPATPTPRHTTPMTGEQLTNNTWKWACFIYIKKETTFITNLLRKTDLKITLRTSNTIQSLLMHKQDTKYMQSGVYKLTCPDYNKAYVGQAGRSSKTRSNEHKNTFRLNYRTSNFATHLIEKSHSFGTIHNTMRILKHHIKGTHLNTVARFYIYAEYIKKNHLNDKHTTTPNRIFEVLLKNPNHHNPLPQTHPLSL